MRTMSMGCMKQKRLFLNRRGCFWNEEMRCLYFLRPLLHVGSTAKGWTDWSVHPTQIVRFLASVDCRAMSPFVRSLCLLSVLLLGGSLLLVVEAFADATSVTNVSFIARSDGQGYVVRVRASAPIQAYGMPYRADDHLLEWTLYNARLSDGYRPPNPAGPVKRYTTTIRNGHLVLRFHLKPDAEVEAQAYRDRASDDLLLNLAYRSASSQGSASSVTAASSRRPSASGRTTSGAPEGSSKAARERWRLDTVVIDPGHGGKDQIGRAHV